MLFADFILSAGRFSSALKYSFLLTGMVFHPENAFKNCFCR
jgi:hypothetical protein